MKIRLQGHEKFTLRDGWITKGLDILSEEKVSTVFSSDSAPDVFGIGTNMVKSLRFWLKAFCLTEDVKAGVKLSELGKIIKKNDYYIEDIFTLWILHSNIVKNCEIATSWYVFFNKFDLVEFDKENLLQAMVQELTKIKDENTKSISQKSLSSDLDVLLSMYSKGRTTEDPEDKNSSPFAQLGLIKQAENKKYVRTSPDKRILNEYLVLYEISDHLKNSDSLSIASLLEGDNSLTAIYHMSVIDINRFLDILQDKGYIVVNRTAGLDVIYKTAEITNWEVLEEYYKQNGKRG